MPRNFCWLSFSFTAALRFSPAGGFQYLLQQSSGVADNGASGSRPIIFVAAQPQAIYALRVFQEWGWSFLTSNAGEPVAQRRR
ncbi:hypothetical protein BN134_2793 [Cronobacter dublinensis 1210]|uniref:Uncharacterized protein n=1 Tax=Cronobacter dublinensis 1210 TaxID=1208656 RepID=A0ABP1W913_9ENTR|nr:hypothetical protein BN134_2793 [Cronobacter dublinensis 1210]